MTKSPVDAKHTPLSMYEISTGHGRVPKYQIRGDGFSFTVVDKEIAAFIVKAVNCHDELVEALKTAQFLIKQDLRNRPYGENQEYINQIEKVLAKEGA